MSLGRVKNAEEPRDDVSNLPAEMSSVALTHTSVKACFLYVGGSQLIVVIRRLEDTDTPVGVSGRS
jgi:hypothetical protein